MWTNVSLHFCSTNWWPGHDLNSNASLNLDTSLSFLQGYTGNSKIACTINSIYKCPPKVERLDVYRVIQTININCTYIQRSFIM